MATQVLFGRVSKTLLLVVCVLAANIGREPAAGAAAVPACQRRCGDVDVPYPFGLDTDDPSCYLDWVTFSLTCNTSRPPKLFWGDFDVISISIDDAKMNVLTNLSYDCYNASGFNDYYPWDAYLGDTTTTFSYTDNIYIATGCDTQAEIKGLTSKKDIGGFSVFNYTGGCSSSCHSLEQIQGGDCSGFGCCQSPIPKGLRGYSITMYSSNNHSDVLDFNPCGYSFLVEKNNYTFSVADLEGMPRTRKFPTVLDWYVGKQSCEIAEGNRSSYACISDQSQCINSPNGPGYVCKCSPGYKGNPYQLNGCQDINECQNPESCRRGAVCNNTPGNYSCTCPPGTVGDPYLYGCDEMPKKQTRSAAVLGISLGISCGIGILLLLVGTTFIWKRITNQRTKRQRHMCFKNNHDLLLQRLVFCDQTEGIVDRIKFFSLKDLEKSTNNFDISRVVGDGGHGTVYKGILDLQVVAIKKSKVELEIERQQFINEVILLSQISHRNIVKLVGCCLESEIPMLVYEFISNGTLSTHLHLRSQDNPLPWDDRLRIATEISSALAYMHKKANVSIYHRDLKSSNILLDDTLATKVSDFGASRSISMDQTHISTNIEGTLGYLDPEYMHTGRLTEKSDVYSLGVILVELLTGKKPTSKLSHLDERNLTTHFIWAVKNGKLLEVVDSSIVGEASREELQLIANLAICSLHLRGDDRPTMKEVELTLEGLMKGKENKQKERSHIKVVDDKNLLCEASDYMENSIKTVESVTKVIDLGGMLTLSENQAR